MGHTNENTTLIHWGIKGQRWGVRRYQNKNGSLTPEGLKRYSDNYKSAKRTRKKASNRYNAVPSVNNYNSYVKADREFRMGSGYKADCI